jgi:hypothetical protein
MKKIIVLLAIVLSGIAAHAQIGSAIKLPLKAGDTILNAGTTNRVIKFTGGYSGANIQVNVTLVSGTGAGTLTLLSSLDGVNYKVVGSPYTITNVGVQSAPFTVTAPLPTYLKIAGAGSGTQLAVLSYWYNDPIYQRN